MFGFLVINKPQGRTSRQTLDHVSRPLKPNKVGHAGTLDPLATGVLVATIGPATRLTRFVQQLPKSYRGGFRLGVSSNTEDIDGELTLVTDAPRISRGQLESELENWTGDIKQRPPAFSALKVKGKRAYELARRGDPVKLKARCIQVFQLKLLTFDYPDFELEIQCGSGTYIRSLGRDIARALGTDATMTSLERTSIGSFSLADSIPIEPVSVETIHRFLIPATADRLGLEQVQLDTDAMDGLEVGSPVALPEQSANELVGIDAEGRMLAVLKRADDRMFNPTINFYHYWQASMTDS